MYTILNLYGFIMLFVRTSLYQNGEWSNSKLFLNESKTPSDLMMTLKQESEQYTLKKLNLIPSILSEKIDYSLGSKTFIYANKIFQVDKNLQGLTPEQILKMINIRKRDLMSLWTYSLSVNNTETLFNVSETLTIYSGLKQGSRIRTKRKIINYISVSHNKVNALYFDKNDVIVREMFNFYKENYGVKTKSEFIMRIFEDNGKLDEVKLYWKLKILGDKQLTKIYEKTYIIFKTPDDL